MTFVVDVVTKLKISNTVTSFKIHCVFLSAMSLSAWEEPNLKKKYEEKANFAVFYILCIIINTEFLGANNE